MNWWKGFMGQHGQGESVQSGQQDPDAHFAGPELTGARVLELAAAMRPAHPRLQVFAAAFAAAVDAGQVEEFLGQLSPRAIAERGLVADILNARGS